MAEQSNSSPTEKSALLALENSENTAEVGHEMRSNEKANKLIPPGQNKDESTKQKPGNSPSQTLQKAKTKIPVKSSGKQSKKTLDNSSTKANSSHAKTQDENISKIGHSRSKTEPFVAEHKDGKQSSSSFRSREELKNELLEKTKRIVSLEEQLDDLKATMESQNAEEMQQKNLVNMETIEKSTNSDVEDVERKVKLLSEENYELRERLLKKDVEIEKLKTQERNAEENIVNKILKKENCELHHEKEQLKLERDRLRHVVTEKENKVEKLVAGLKDMENQLFQAKRALESRAKASTHLEDRLKKVDSELNRYRERYGKLEKQNNKGKRLSEKSGNSRSRSLSPGGRESSEREQDLSQNHVLMLQQRESKLLEDRSQLEKSVNVLTNTITELEEQLQKFRPGNRSTHERGSQTDLGIGSQLTSTVIQGPYPSTQGPGKGTAVDKGHTLRRCRGIVQSLGNFFEELIQNNQDTSAGISSKSRRTSIAAQRASELLHELSISMEHTLNTKSHEREPSRADRSTSPVRRSTAVNTDVSQTIWDKLCDEVAKHEFTFDPAEGTSGLANDKEREVMRAERGLQRMRHENSEANGDKAKDNMPGFTKDDATRMMNVSRKQTESVVKEMLTKHQGEIRALLENGCQSSPIPTVAFDIRNPETVGQDEATMAVKELDCFKTRTTKVQSLVLKLQEIVECAKKDKQSAERKLQSVAEEIRQKDTLLQAKSLELRRRHGKTLESEKALHGEVNTLKNEKAAIIKENARLHELCRQKDLQMLQKAQDIKAIQQRVDERDEVQQQNLANMRKKVEEAWGLYESVKSRAERRTVEFSEAAEKLKASQGYLLDLWQTLKTVDNVVEANENDEL